jgi:hypothetical protein
MINVKDAGLKVATVFVAAVFARFGWELGGWVVRHLF